MTTQNNLTSLDEPSSKLHSESLNDSSSILSDKRIKLNVGGKIFETYQRTLIQSRYFNSMFSKFAESKSNDEIFIDRSSELFEHVLNYLRDSSFKIPKKCYPEFLFYGIDWPSMNKFVQQKQLTATNENKFHADHCVISETNLLNKCIKVERKVPKLIGTTYLGQLTHSSHDCSEFKTIIQNISRTGDTICNILLHINDDVIHNISTIELDCNGRCLGKYDIDFIIAYNKFIHKNTCNRILKIPFWFDNEENDELYMINILYCNVSLKMVLKNNDIEINNNHKFYVNYKYLTDESRNNLSNRFQSMIHKSIQWEEQQIIQDTENEYKIKITTTMRRLMLYCNKKFTIDKIIARYNGLDFIDYTGDFIHYYNVDTRKKLGSKKYYVFDFSHGNVSNYNAGLDIHIYTKEKNILCMIEKIIIIQYSKGLLSLNR